MAEKATQATARQPDLVLTAPDGTKVHIHMKPRRNTQ